MNGPSFLNQWINSCCYYFLVRMYSNIRDLKKKKEHFVKIQRGFGQSSLKLIEILSFPLEFYSIVSANLLIINKPN